MEGEAAAGAIDGSGDAAVGAAAATIAAEGGRLAFAAEAVVGACIGLEGLGATGAGAGIGAGFGARSLWRNLLFLFLPQNASASPGASARNTTRRMRILDVLAICTKS